MHIAATHAIPQAEQPAQANTLLDDGTGTGTGIPEITRNRSG
ncbi:hypothetical protein [Nocardia sp. NPDC004123]